MRMPDSRLLLVGFASFIALGFGCGGGGGCGGLAALPKDPAPWGLPGDQTIEGGMQARVTKPGFDKISALIPALAKSALPTQAKPICVPRQQQAVKLFGSGADIKECDAACGGGTGCPAWVDLRPDIAPPGGISVSMKDGTNPVVDIDAAFDVHLVLPIQYRLCAFGACGGWKSVCDLHVDGPGTHVKAGIQLGIDPVTGKLTIALGDVAIPGLNLGVSNCGLASDILDVALDFVNAIAKSFIGNAIIGLLKPQLSKLIAGFLPDPLGLVGALSTGEMLASYNAPPQAALETLVVPGGYVSAKSGGLNLGVIAGMNSDRDPGTRGAGKVSEAALCVPQRPVLNFAGPPWNLPMTNGRPTFSLLPAPQFAGSPDPVDGNGKTRDVAIGVSRTFLDLAGFHIYNSGTLCLAISGGVLSALNAGTISILIPSLGNILENKKAPVALTLRPETPLRFTIGTGTDADPLLRINITDIRADFYAFIEERYVRIFTLALDLNVGLNLAVTMGMDGKPALAPMITGIDKANVQARVSNTDLLAEDPKKLAKSLLGLIDVAVGQLGGGIKPIALPSLMGFSLDGLAVQRVQTPQDDFLAIFGSLAQNPMGMPFPLPEEIVGYERIPNGADTTAQILDVSVPPPEVIREAVERGEIVGGNLPTVTLKLGASSRTPEWSYRIDNGIWHAWSDDARPTISDAAFLLQGHHTIDVRARDKGDWSTEDQTPQHLEVVIDSVPPDLKLHVDRNTINFGGSDNVSEADGLRYAWKTPEVEGGQTEPGRRDYLTLDEAWTASAHGQSPLTVIVWDEQGNHREAQMDLSQQNEFHGRMTTPAGGGGCGCSVGARQSIPPIALLALAPLFGLVLRRRRAKVEG